MSSISQDPVLSERDKPIFTTLSSTLKEHLREIYSCTEQIHIKSVKIGSNAPTHLVDISVAWASPRKKVIRPPKTSFKCTRVNRKF